MSLLIDYPIEITELFVDCIWCYYAQMENDGYSTCTDHCNECVEFYEGSEYDYFTICDNCGTHTEMPCDTCGYTNCEEWENLGNCHKCNNPLELEYGTYGHEICRNCD